MIWNGAATKTMTKSPYKLAEQRLTTLINSGLQGALKGGFIGIEKESLRVGQDGKIAQTPHPISLGSALTHPYITTDYSEALIEFITPPFANVRNSLQFLQDTHKFVYDKLDNEILWGTSMPCVIAGDRSIPIAQYGKSNIGMMKTIYRRGLGYRYGKVMQVIAGVHFNFSMPEAFWPVFQQQEKNSASLQDFISDGYFALIRNLQRFGWLIPYLFGASPAVCKSFLGGKASNLAEFNASTYYEPFATSLRMGDIGYQNKKEAECGFKASYDNIQAYVASITKAINMPCAEFVDIGVVVNGEYRQLNTSILQIENEYYSTIRPKQILNNNEKPSLALKRRGVQYVELRSLDVNAFHPLGITEEQLRFLEAFLIFCLFHESPTINALERREIDLNQNAAAHRGRDPSLYLQRNGQSVLLRDWAAELCEAMQGFCELLDLSETDKPYTKSLESQKETIRDADRTPSSRMLEEMRKNNEGFFLFAMRMSQQHHEYFNSLQLNGNDNSGYKPHLEDITGSHINENKLDFFTELAEKSIGRLKEIESADSISFDEYLRNYFAQS